MKLKKKVQTRLEIITLVGLFISGGFVEEAPLIALLGLIIFGACTIILCRYGVFPDE